MEKCQEFYKYYVRVVHYSVLVINNRRILKFNSKRIILNLIMTYELVISAKKMP